MNMLIDGALVPASNGDTYETFSPASGKSLGFVPAATSDDVDRAVASGKRAYLDWAAAAPAERAKVLRKMAATLREHRDELGLLDAQDGGNPVTAMKGDVDLAAELLEVFADWAMNLGGETVVGRPNMLHYTVREPYGVVARLIPYNHPLMFAASRIAAPLLAGNAVVLKAPDQTPLSALRMAELFAPLVPPGVLSVLSGFGVTAGAAMVAHPDVRRIAFTGSVPTGQTILQSAARAGIKNTTLELGGKNPMVVLEDADPAVAAAGAITGMNFHWTAGQSCGSTSRLLVHRSLVDEVVERVAAGAKTVRMGDPLDPETEMGAMVTPQHRDRVMGFVERAKGEGLRAVAGGGASLKGAFVEPTVFADVPPTAEIFNEEIFGPVLSVTAFDTEDEAIGLVNDSPLGLTASLWTQDVAKAHILARKVEAGYVWLNTSSRHFVGLPFGGVKNSGLGREEHVEELLSFTQVKAVSLDLRPGSR
ncbi:aldehyde dehydrogenase family protein [Microbispora bryophytorum]|uniref:aldehyde dehydrogenase family protein n=1 Tax=Microbispora bryophytorum TaxID=1460882 RepID=UPI0033D7673B